MSKFRVSESGGPSIPAADAASRTFGIVGQRGTGKSSAAAVLVEGFVEAGARVVVADPTGVWYGLAHAGTGPGLPKTIILGGEHQNAPLEETGGQLVADLVVSADYSAVVLDMKLLRKGQQVRFMADFLEALYHQNREALHLVIDEAGRFAPQALREKGYAIRLLGAIEDVVKLGRSRGLGCTLVEQRPAHISKSVFEQIETLVAFRLMGPNDRKALSDWIEAKGDPAREKEAMDAVAKMETGTGLVWSPAFLDFFGIVKWRFPSTYDSRRTPKPGERKKGPGPRAPVDLDDLTKRMAATIERAKADDPKALRAEIARLKAAKPAAVVAAPKVVEREVEKPVLSKRQSDDLHAVVRETRALAEKASWLSERSALLFDKATRLDMDVRGALQSRATAAPAPASAALPRARPVPAVVPARPQRAAEAPAEGGLGRCERAILRVLRQYGDCESGRLTLLSGYRWTGGFSNALGVLRRTGLIEGENTATMALTAAGVSATEGIEPPPTGAALVEHWASHASFGKCERAIFRALLDAPSGLDRDALIEATGYRWTGGFSNSLGNLRTAGVLVGRNTDTMRISDDLLEAARITDGARR